MASSSVKSAERVLAVLDLLARSARPVPTMAIVRGCAIPKSSAHHLLNVMRDRRFVSYYEDEHAWGLGVAAFEIDRPTCARRHYNGWVATCLLN